MAEDPKRIGPYTIGRKLGEGGMGVVYQAEQTEPVRRMVALKLIRGGAGSEDLAVRFEAERQALAVMEHPHIAKVLDGGTTSSGNPYFVMEYVDGAPITEYCDRNELGIPERLALFREVCDAIQHAHQKGIIHRDLKPNNVLVTEQAGSPLPKVIDFGVAKAAGVKLTEETLATQHGAMIGTPAYMSPEQAEGAGLDIDTRSDVYSLGVLLYELLVGRVPLDPAELGFARFLARLVMDDTPTPTPSTRLATDPDTAATISASRRTTPERLARHLSGDLDWIVMRAIETDRDRRYGSARELAADLDRYLRDQPVQARPPSASYRARKFVRRNRAAVLAGAAAVILLVGGAVASTIGFVRATRAETVAVAEGERAREEATTSTQVSEFLTGLFEAANPGFVGRSDVTARELLEQGVASIDRDLADQPVIRARLLLAMARAFHGTGEFNQARHLKLRALELREEALGPDHPEVAYSLAELVDDLPVYNADPSSRTSPEMIGMAERALAIREDNFDSDPDAWAASVRQVTDLYEGSGRLQEGLDLLAGGIERITALRGTTDPTVLDMERRYAITFANAGREEEAIPLMERLLEKVEALDPPDTLHLAAVTNNLAWIYSSRLDRPADALPHFERAVAIERASWDGVSPMALTDGLFSLANTYSSLGRHEEAVAVWEGVIRDFTAVYGPEHPETVGYHISLAMAHLEGGTPERAIEPLQVTARVLGRVLDEGVSDRTRGEFFTAVGFYGVALRDSGHDDPVGAVLELAGGHPERRHGALETYSRMIERDAGPPEIVGVRERVIELLGAIPVEDPQRSFDRLKWTFVLMTMPLLQMDAADELRALAPRWEAAVEEIAPGDNPWTLQVLRDLASVMYRGEPEFDEPPIPELQPEAVAFLERALAMRERMDGDGIHLIEHLVPLRHALLIAGRDAEAARVQERARALLGARLAELEQMAAAGEIVEAARWNGNCWWGALAEVPETVMPACNAAVEGAFGAEVPRFHDSRAVARAVMGDLDGAIEDLEVYVRQSGPGDRRSEWLEELRAGRNPLTGFTLGALGF